MKSVRELDIYLKAFFYSLNIDAEFYSTVAFSDELRSLQKRVVEDWRVMRCFRDEVEGLGFYFTVARIAGMLGDREFRDILEPTLLCPADYLKIFPRVLYLSGFLEQPETFQSFRYFVRYYPPVLVNFYTRAEQPDEFSVAPGFMCVLGTHLLQDAENLISYNLAGEVGIGTVVEEELHSKRVHVHGKPIKREIIARIRESAPQVVTEIEVCLGIILSTEETKFKYLGETLGKEKSAELMFLESFIDLFEAEINQSAQVQAIQEVCGPSKPQPSAEITEQGL